MNSVFDLYNENQFDSFVSSIKSLKTSNNVLLIKELYRLKNGVEYPDDDLSEYSLFDLEYFEYINELWFTFLSSRNRSISINMHEDNKIDQSVAICKKYIRTNKIDTIITHE